MRADQPACGVSPGWREPVIASEAVSLDLTTAG